MGNGLILTDGKIWAEHSKVVVPAFSNSMLDCYLKIMHKQVETFMELVVRRENNEYFDIHEDISKFSLDGEL